MKELKVTFLTEEFVFNLDTQVKIIDENYDYKKDKPLEYLYIQNIGGNSVPNFLIYLESDLENSLFDTGVSVESVM